MMSRNSGRLRKPYSARDHTSGEKRAGRSPRPDRYERGPGARTPKAMSASLASAMMKAREEGFALISASLVSSDFVTNEVDMAPPQARLGFHPFDLPKADPPINTPLQRGVRLPEEVGNRFNGFGPVGQTVETVSDVLAAHGTPL